MVTPEMHEFSQEIEVLLRARFTLIVITTSEEARAVGLIRQVSEHLKRDLLLWDIAAGFIDVNAGKVPPASDPLAALDAIRGFEGAKIVVLKDFHEFWTDPRIKRRLRNLAEELKFTKTSLVITSPSTELPKELRDDAVQLVLEGPSQSELDTILADLESTPGLDNQLTPEGRTRLIGAAVGLTANEALRSFSKAIVGDGTLDDSDIDLVTQEKKLIIRESGALEFYSAQESPQDVGGLEVLKRWIDLRQRAFGEEAKEYGLPAPRGIALIGIPGTGKSLTAKAIGGMWHLPLIRLDVGAVFGSLVGESEERIRTALRLTEQIAPCVLWIDELEKSLASGGGDNGTSQRVMGTILTWMQDKKAPVFVVATANDISKLPPELLRRGRFDEVFFLDLPTDDERREIIHVHLKRRGRNPESFNIDKLVQLSALYTGAEIEQAIIDAMYHAFDENREITSDDLEGAVKSLVPLSRSQSEQIESLRMWLKEGRAQSASFIDRNDAVRASQALAALSLDLPPVP